MSSEAARALKDKLQVTSGDDTLTVLLALSMENTVLSSFTGLAFFASSITWARLSLSITVWVTPGCACCGALFLRRLRAKSPSEGLSSCSDCADADEGTSTYSATRSAAGSVTKDELGNLDRMILVPEERVGAQEVYIESLGEMEGKR